MSSVDYEVNANQRTPCVLVLDASGSMNERTSNGMTRIEQLNEGLRVLEQQLKDDDTAFSRVMLSIVIVGGPSGKADVLMDWTDVDQFEAFDLTAAYQTPLAEGLLIGLQLIERCKADMRASGVSYTRPWMMVLTDGEATDTELWPRAVDACRSAVQSGKCLIYPIGVDGANMSLLSDISQPMMLNNIKFRDLFVWLSKSLSTLSRSKPGDQVQLPSPSPWAVVNL